MAHKIEKWNTGRLYAHNGQIVCAQVQDDGSVLFADLSRMVCGHIDPPIYESLDTAQHVRNYVMHNYDRNFYKGDREADVFMNDCYGQKLHH